MEIDSTPVTNDIEIPISVAPWQWPLEVITTAGGFGGDPWEISGPYEVCNFLLGDMVATYGNMYIPPETIKHLEETATHPFISKTGRVPYRPEPIRRSLPVQQPQPLISPELNPTCGQWEKWILCVHSSQPD